MKKRTFLIIVLAAIITYSLYFNDSNLINNIHKNPIVDQILNGTDHTTYENNESIVIIIKNPIPDFLLSKAYELVNALKGNYTLIQVVGYLKFPKSDESLFKLDYKNGKTTLLDIRKPKFVATQDLWLYNFEVIGININLSKAIVNSDYFGSSEEFLDDLLDSAFNVFEDIPWINSITYNINGLNKSITINKEELFKELNGSNSNFIFLSDITENSYDGCAKSKKDAYRRFAYAYNHYNELNHQNASQETLIKAYAEYEQAKACYDNWDEK